MSNQPSIIETLYDESIRTDKIIWIAGNCTNPGQDFQDFFEYELDSVKELLGILPRRVDHGDMEEIASLLVRKGKTGFLVQAATPEPLSVSGDSYSFSWGCSYLKWFYTEVFDEAFVSRLVDWKNEILEEARRKSQAEQSRTQKPEGGE